MRNQLVVRVGAALLAASFLAVASPALADTTGAPAQAFADAPPAAPAFDGWVVKGDTVLPRESVNSIESKLGGKIKSLRNVVYDVQGKKAQINVVVADDSAEGDKLYKSLTHMKPAWAVVRKGDVLYELIGENESVDELKKAHDKLAAQ